MTIDTVTPQSGPTQDPLSRLRHRIEQAQDPSADPAPDEAVRREDDDPLEALERRIEEASDPSRLRAAPAGAAPPPLSELLEAFDHARALLDEPIGYLQEVDADDPLERMRRQLEREADELGGRDAVPLPRETVPERSSAGTRPAPSGDATSAVGREVLRMLESDDLPGPVRAEAVRRLAAAIESDDRGELREVLRLLIRGAPDK